MIYFFIYRFALFTINFFRTVASPVKVAEEKEVVDGVEVGTTTPAKSPVKAKDTTESTETSEAPTNGSPEKRDVAKEDTASETPNGDSTGK